jgi:hypothetical protein
MTQYQRGFCRLICKCASTIVQRGNNVGSMRPKPTAKWRAYAVTVPIVCHKLVRVRRKLKATLIKLAIITAALPEEWPGKQART